MSSFRLALALVLCLVVGPISLAAPVPGAKVDWSKFEVPVPKTSLAVLQLNGAGAARDRLGKLIDAVVPKKAEQFKTDFDNALKDNIKTRDLTALRPEGRIYLTLLNLDELRAPELPLAFLLPVELKPFRERLLTPDEQKSYETVRDGVGSFQWDGVKMYVVELTPSKYLALTPNAEATKTFQKLEALKGSDLADPVAATFLGSDVSLFFNLTELNARHGDMIATFRNLITAVFGMGGNGILPGVDPGQLEVAKVMMTGLFQALEDGTGAALGFEFRPDALALRAEMSFRPDSPSGKQLATEKLAVFDQLLELPRGQAQYSAGQYGPAAKQAFLGLSREFAAPADDKSRATVEEYNQLVAEAWGAGTVSFSGPLTRGLQLSTPADPKKLTETHLKVLLTLPREGRYQNVPLKARPEVQAEDQKYAGFVWHRAKIVVDFDAAVANLTDENLKKASLESMKRLVDETTTYWFGTDGKQYLQVQAPDWERAKAVIDAVQKPTNKAGSDATFVAARNFLPREATQILLLEVNGSFSSLSRLLKSVLEAMPGFPGAEVPDLKPIANAPPAFVGLAVLMKPGSAGFSAVAPIPGLKAIYAITEPAFPKKE